MKNMRETYHDFIAGAAEGRHLSLEAVAKTGQGHVWTAERATKLGLVDKLGGLETAVRTAKNLAGIPASEKVGLIFLPAPESLLDKIRDAASGADQILEGALAPRQMLDRIEALARLPLWTLASGLPKVQ